MNSGAATGRRPYDSPVRKEQAVATRGRILAAGAAIVREFSSWDWRELTFRAVAARAGVSERTVFRHFASEQDLHRAVMRQLEIEAGVQYEGLSLANLSGMARRVFESLDRFAVRPPDPGTAPDLGPAFTEEDERRRIAVLEAVAECAGGWSGVEQRQAAGVLDVLWNVPSFERLVVSWGLDRDDAISAVSWALETLVAAVRDGAPRPGAA